MDIAFIGGGVMAEALIGGIINGGIASGGEVFVGEPISNRRSYLENTYGLRASSNNSEVINKAELIILAVKPQIISGVMADIKDIIQGNQTILSIVAGTNSRSLREGLDHDLVIRVMPNIPAQIGKGMSVWTASEDVSDEIKEITGAILNTLGEEIYVSDETYIDMSTALSASGPAYVFLFIEALIDAGTYLGMNREMTRQLVLQTVMGSAELVKESGRHPAELKDMVTSPGGTTIEAIRALESAGFRSAIFDGVIQAFQKSKALGG